MMKTETNQKKNRLRERLISISLVLLVFSILVAIVSYRSREVIRQQVLNRDADLIFLLTQMGRPILEQGRFSGDLPVWMIDGTKRDSGSPSPELRGIIAVQLVDNRGDLVIAIPDNYLSTHLKTVDLLQLKKQRPVSRFHPEIRLDTLFVDPEFYLDDLPVPLLEVVIPLLETSTGRLEGAIRIWIDGKSMSRELALLDWNMTIQLGVGLGAGYVIISLVLFWAFRRLQKINLVLSDRTLKLKDANRELVLAAKSSAIGAISAHLVHGLKNPLAGLQEFVSSQSQLDDGSGSDTETEWHTARETTYRMTRLLQEIVKIMSEETDTGGYEITVSEITEMVNNHVADLAKQRNVELQSLQGVDHSFSNREGNLVMLILNNLVKNAVEASASGAKTVLKVRQENSHLQFFVEDEGGGLPKHLQNNPFLPCISTKPDGNGIGLAISHQLARHIGADLQLDRTDSRGTCFTLRIPTGKSENS